MLFRSAVDGVSLALYAYIFKTVHIATLWQKTKAADPTYVLTAILIYLAVQVVSAYRWYCLLTPLGIKVPFSRIIGLYFMGMFSSLFLPATRPSPSLDRQAAMSSPQSATPPTATPRSPSTSPTASCSGRARRSWPRPSSAADRKSVV